MGKLLLSEISREEEEDFLENELGEHRAAETG
jgi:hypothetical protein